jgi:hypothetical protein
MAPTSELKQRQSAFLRAHLDFLTKTAETSRDLGKIMLDVTKVVSPLTGLQAQSAKDVLDDITGKFEAIAQRLSKTKGDGSKAIDPFFSRYDPQLKRFVDARQARGQAGSVPEPTDLPFSSGYSSGSDQRIQGSPQVMGARMIS